MAENVGVRDLVLLDEVSEARIVENLRQRLLAKIIYVRAPRSPLPPPPPSPLVVPADLHRLGADLGEPLPRRRPLRRRQRQQWRAGHGRGPAGGTHHV